MNLEIDKRYSTYSTSIVFHLLHHEEDYNNLWKSECPQLENQLNNFFKNVNCGCRPPLLQFYKQNKFSIDLLTVDFLNKINFDFDEFCQKYGGQELRGVMFSIPNTPADYKDFLASLQAKNAKFQNFTTLQFEDHILITFI